MLEIRTLGGLSIRCDGVPVAAFPSRKADALLVYLSYTRHEHPREMLADFLWDEGSGRDTLANLRTVISGLRRHCGSYITAGRHSVSISEPSMVWLDTVMLERSLAAARIQPDSSETTFRQAMVHIEQALDLYKGDFLAGFSARNSINFEEWLRVERDRLRGLMIEALRQIIPHYTLLGRDMYSTAIQHASKLTQLDPLDEETHRQLMLLLARNGQKKEALQQYAACQNLLMRELGTGPSPETIQLRENIQRAGIRTSIHRPAQHNLPTIQPPIVGREHELADLCDLLANPKCHLITLFGPGGVGKTCLALHAAALQIGRLHNGVYFVSLTPLRSLEQLVASIQQVLRLNSRKGIPSRSTLMHYLADSELLLVLDQLGHLPQAKELIIEILRTAPGVKVMITSWVRLRLQEEWAYKLGGLVYPAEGDDNEPGQSFSAIQLFIENARRITGRSSWSSADKRAIASICRLVDGLPLAIEHAASWLNTLSCRDIAGELEKSFDLLTTNLQDVPFEHRSMQAILDVTWEMLSVEEQIAIHKLAGLYGSFGRMEAAAVGVSLNILSALIEKSVLTRGATEDYQLPGMLRRYVWQKYLHSNADTRLPIGRVSGSTL